jgi:hypothetical protein
MRRFAVTLWAFAILSLGLAHASLATRTDVLDLSQVTNPNYLGTENATVGPVVQGPDGPQFNVTFNVERSRIRQVFTTPLDWSDKDMLTWCINNKENRTVNLVILFQVRADQNDYTGHLAYQMVVPANKRVRYLMVFRETNPAQFGVRCYPPVLDTEYVRINPSPTFERNSIYSWRILLLDSQRASVDLCDFSLLTQRRDMNGISDEFFQYAYRDWPEKVHSVADMIADRNAEQIDLAMNPGPGNIEGTTSLPNQGASTRWSIRTINGKKYLVHPNGRPFWSFGLQGIHDIMSTWIDGRQEMFQFLPDPNGPDGDLYGTAERSIGQGGGTVTSFRPIKYNLRRKYGPNYFADWIALSKTRLRSWGMNTVGPWCYDDLYDNSMPYTFFLDTKDFPTRLNTPLVHWTTLPDPYASNFESWMTTQFRDRLRNHNGRTNYMGVFVDNEMSWGHIMDGTPQSRYAVAIGVLRSPSTQPAKAAFVQMLTSKYSSISRLNSAWGTRFTSWNQVRSNLAFAPGNFNNAMTLDLRTFTQRYAQTYFSKVRRALNAAGNTGLYLGCRFWHYTPEIIAGAAQSVDALSFNNYSPTAEFPWSYLASLPKPVIISEWSNPINARGSIGWRQQSIEASRAEIVAQLTAALRNPNIIGLHWYELHDMPVTGHAQHFWNVGFGVLDITDQPKSEVVSAFREIGSSMYTIRRQ